MTNAYQVIITTYLFSLTGLSDSVAMASEAEKSSDGTTVPTDTVSDQLIGPEIHVQFGTTVELERELDRLVKEFKSLDVNADKSIKEKYQVNIDDLQNMISERSDSPLTDCLAQLSFNGKYLILADYKNDFLIKWDAVSGRKKDNGTFDYSRKSQGEKNSGPIPEGVYWINPAEVKNMYRFWLWYSWGLRFVPIHPFDSTHALGRGRFKIHGGASPGSAGCIDIPWQTGSFKKALKGYSACKLKLFVDYGLSYEPSNGSTD